MDVVTLHDRAIAETDKIVAGVTADDLAKQTPCTEFKVTDLLQHLVGSNVMFTKIAKGDSFQGAQALPDMPGDDPIQAWKESSRQVSEAWQDRDLLQKTVDLPFGTVPAEFGLGIHFLEVLVHGWDLAKATGQEAKLDPDLAQAAYDMISPVIEMGRAGGAFGPEVPVSPDAPIHERLVGLLGRAP